MTDEASTLDCPKMKPLVLGCTWKGFSGNVHTCSIGVEVHKNRLELAEAAATFNHKRLTVTINTKEIDQEGLFDGDDESIFVITEVVADTAAMSISKDKYKFRLTFHKESVDIETLSNFCSENGTLTVIDIATKMTPEKHPDVEAGKDKPQGQPALMALGAAAQNNEIAQLVGENGKPVLSAKVAFALNQQGVRTCADLQKMMTDKPEFWETDLVKNTKGLSRARLDKLVDAFQLFMAQASEDDGGLRFCTGCGAVHSDAICKGCGSDYFEAIHDETLNDEFEWELEHCDRTPIAKSGPVSCEVLLKQDEFESWHFGTRVVVKTDDGMQDEYDRLPCMVGTRYDKDTAYNKGLVSLLDELKVADADHPSPDLEACLEAVSLVAVVDE